MKEFTYPELRHYNLGVSAREGSVFTTSENDSTDTDLQETLTETLQVREEQHILLYFFRQACRRHRVRSMNTQLMATLTATDGSKVPLIDGLQADATNTDADVFPTLESIAGNDWYLGARQLMALSDLLRVEVQVGNASGSPLDRMAFSLTPLLTHISLRHLCLDFGVCEADKLRSYSAIGSSTAVGGVSDRIGGNEVLCYFLRALRGHPSLREVDLSSNRLGPWVLPELSKFVKNTPTLTNLHLQDTLLSQAEIDCANAQCLLNRLRLQATDKAALDSWQSKWREAQGRWLLRKVRVLQSELQSGSAVVHNPSGLPGRSVATPYLQTECTQQELDAVTAFLHRDVNNDGSLEADDDTDGALSDTWRSLECREVAEDLCPHLQTLLSPVLCTRHMRYYRSEEVHAVTWSRDCVEVLMCSFVDPLRAQMTFMGGRPVPRGVPRLAGTGTFGKTRDLTELRLLVSQSKLMQHVRAVLLPPLPKPASIFCFHSMNDRHLHSTEEENYYATVEEQTRQWDLLLDKVIQHMQPAHYQENQVLYREGERPYWLYFLPGTEDRAEVEIDFQRGLPPQYIHNSRTTTPSSTEELTRQTILVSPGEFFGDAELLSSHVWYFPPVHVKDDYLTDGKTVLLDPLKNKPFRDRLRQTYAQRMSSATVRIVEDKGEHQQQDSRSPRCGKGPAPRVRLWLLPFPVVLHYLYEPLQTFHQRQATHLRRIKLETFSPLLGAHLGSNISHHIRHPSAVSHSAEDNRIATGKVLQQNVYILEEGDYTLTSFTFTGRQMEESLTGGVVLLNAEIFAMDEAARRAFVEANPPFVAPTASILMGKEAALRKYREEKRRQWLAAEGAPHTSTQPVIAETDSGQVSAIDVSLTSREQSLCIGHSAICPQMYFVIANDDFVRLPECLRVHLTVKNVVLDSPE